MGTRRQQLRHLRPLAATPDQGGDPADREREQQHQPGWREDGQRAAVGPESEDSPRAKTSANDSACLTESPRGVPHQGRGSGDREAAEPVEDADADVGVEPVGCQFTGHGS
jgi:hypothetical protein